MDAATDALLVAEALRVYRRYEMEVVEALNLCPWAARARADGQIAERVILGATLELRESLAAVEEVAAQRDVEIGILIYPHGEDNRAGFERFVARLVEADSARRQVGATPFAMAAFHPEAEPDLGDPERLVPFLRRTPDPTIQLVRRSALERVREGYTDGTQFVDIQLLDARHLTAEDTRPLRARIAQANSRTVSRVGVNGVRSLFAEILRDRDDSYGKLGLPARAPCPSS